MERMIPGLHGACLRAPAPACGECRRLAEQYVENLPGGNCRLGLVGLSADTELFLDVLPVPPPGKPPGLCRAAKGTLAVFHLVLAKQLSLTEFRARVERGRSAGWETEALVLPSAGGPSSARLDSLTAPAPEPALRRLSSPTSNSQTSLTTSNKLSSTNVASLTA